MKSLKSRLNLGVLIISLVFFTSLIIANVIFFHKFGENFVETRLQHDTDALLVALNVGQDGALILDEHNLNPIFLQPRSGHYYRIELKNDVLLSRSLWDQTISVARLPLGEKRVFHEIGPAGQELLVLEGSYMKSGQNIWISVAENYTPIIDSIWSVTIPLILLNGVIMIILMLFQRVIVDRGMATLKKTTEELKSLDAGEIDFLSEQVPTEISPLVQEINNLLVMVQNRVKRSTTALGNLAHALKTPLAFIEQCVTDASSSNREQACEDIKGAVNQIKFQLNSELRRARIIGSSMHGQKIDIAESLNPLIDTLKTIYMSKGISFQLDIEPDAVFKGDRHDLMELLGNLLDNACKWASKTVHIAIEQNDGLSIIVEDDGPGIGEEQLALIENRGARLDESGDGHGLGLSIVREIADLKGADLRYSRSETFGGLRVSIHLPQ